MKSTSAKETFVPFQRVGELRINADTAILTLQLDITNILSKTTNLLNGTDDPEERETLLTWQNDLKEATKFLSFTSRNKRDLMAWIASITGLFNHFRINQVQNKISNVNEAGKALNQETSQLLHHVEVNDENLKTLASMLHKDEAALWKFNLLTKKKATWQNAERVISATRKLIETLPQHKLTPDAILLFDLEKEWKNLELKVQKRGKEVAMPSWHYLLHVKTSYWTNENTILIAIEVPIKDRKDTQYDLYELQETPLLLNGKFFLAHTKHCFLAVHAVTQATLALSREQLNSFATSILGTWFFHGPIIENHGDQKECVEALWSADSTEVDKWCHLTATYNREYAQPINNTAVLWITNTPTQITTICTNKPTDVKIINQTTIVNIATHCKASSTRLTFLPTNTETFHETIVLKRITTSKDKDTWGLTSWELQQPPMVKDRFQEVQNLLTRKVNLVPVWLAVSIAVIALLVVIIFMIWLYWKAKQQWTLQPVTPTCETDNEND